jgi:hypothetical protein
MNIDLTNEEIELICVCLDSNSQQIGHALSNKLRRYLPKDTHSPETETKEGVVDTSKNKNWKVP